VGRLSTGGGCLSEGFLVTTCLSRLAPEIFAVQTDGRTDGQRGLLLYWPPHCGGPANNLIHICGCRKYRSTIINDLMTNIMFSNDV